MELRRTKGEKQGGIGVNSVKYIKSIEYFLIILNPSLLYLRLGKGDLHFATTELLVVAEGNRDQGLLEGRKSHQGHVFGHFALDYPVLLGDKMKERVLDCVDFSYSLEELLERSLIADGFFQVGKVQNLRRSVYY